MSRLDPTSVAVKTFTGVLPDPLAANSDAWRAATIGAANGHGNARSVVQIQSAVAQGGGKLISPETVELIFDVQSDGVDLVLGLPIKFGIGYGLFQPGLLPSVPDSKICFWGGWGGSLIIMDLDRRLTIGYVMNKMSSGIVGSDRGAAYVQAVYAASRLTSSPRPVSAAGSAPTAPRSPDREPANVDPGLAVPRVDRSSAVAVRRTAPSY